MRLNGFSEKWLEDRLAAGLKVRGLPNFHMSSPSLPGIPDRYVIGAGGLWIEVKQGESTTELKSGFDRQRRFLTQLMRGGDEAWVCALLQPNNYTAPKLYLEPWRRWLQRETTGKYDIFSRMHRSPLAWTDPNEMDALFAYFADYCKGRD